LKPSEEYQAKPSLGDYFLKGKLKKFWDEVNLASANVDLGEIAEAVFSFSFFPC
jgi:hypothetical protein